MYFEIIKDLQLKNNVTRIWLDKTIILKCNKKFNDTFDLFISKIQKKVKEKYNILLEKELRIID